MAGKGDNPLGIRVDLQGVKELQRALEGLERDAEREIEKATLKLSNLLARAVSKAGHAQGAQAALLAGTVKAEKGRTPGVKVGGPGAVGRNHTPANRLLIGSEFGHGKQGGAGKGSRDYAPHGFKPRHSPEGMWIYPTLKREGPMIAKTWAEVADDIVRDFAGWEA